MAVKPTYTYQRGSTIQICLDVNSGSASVVDSIVAKLRRLEDGAEEPTPDTPVAATFSISYRAAAGDIPEGWNLEIPGSESVDLPAGRYYADARKVIGTSPFTTSSCFVVITEPATVTAASDAP